MRLRPREFRSQAGPAGRRRMPARALSQWLRFWPGLIGLWWNSRQDRPPRVGKRDSRLPNSTAAAISPRWEFIDCPIGDARVAYPYYVKRELLDWSAAGSCLGEGPLTTCAVTRRFSVGARPTRRPLSPEATGAGMEVTKCLKPPDSGHEIR